MKCFKKISLVALSLMAMGCAYQIKKHASAPLGTEAKAGGVKQILDQEAEHLSDHEKEEIKEVVLNVSEKYEMDPYLVLSVIHVESHFKPSAKSNRGALGLMQVKTVVVKELAKRPVGDFEKQQLLKDKTFNIHVGVSYLAYLLKRFKGDVNKALMAYNAGPTTVGLYYKNRPAPEGGYQGKVLKTYRRFSEVSL